MYQKTFSASEKEFGQQPVNSKLIIKLKEELSWKRL